MLHLEREAWGKGRQAVAGVDEAGRGPLAGPVFAAAVLFERTFLEREERGLLQALTDSKQLKQEERERFFELLTHCDDVRIGVSQVAVVEIDRLNILRATHLAMRKAILALPLPPDWVLVDGRPVQGLPCPAQAIVKGDGLSLSIAAASVIAKVSRDRYMLELDRDYPQYAFARHKGYGTKLHLTRLRQHGPCPHHRTSFKPVAQCGQEQLPLL